MVLGGYLEVISCFCILVLNSEYIAFRIVLGIVFIIISSLGNIFYICSLGIGLKIGNMMVIY